MLSVYFGLPGHGKSTFAVRQIIKLKKKYPIVYSNLELNNLDFIPVSRDDIGVYALCRGSVWIDEASQLFDNRDFKGFGKEKVKFFNEHRHHRVDINMLVQKYDALDAKIRAITQRVYWIYKYSPILPWFRVWRIPHDILIASKADASKLSGGEIIQGYVIPSLLSRLFCTRFSGRKYFKYFNSYEVEPLPPLPQAQGNFLYELAYIATYGVVPVWTGSSSSHELVRFPAQRAGRAIAR